MTTNEKSIDLLNKLIQVNEDRKEGYKKAMENTADMDLKSLFDQYSKQSGQYVVELSTAVETTGTIPKQKTTVAGDVHRGWMDVKSSLSSNERKSVLESCERGEDSALATYNDVLEERSQIDAALLNTVDAQHVDIKKAHDQIKTLRDGAVAT